MAIKPSLTKPLILLENEDIKFVEDDFSSSSSEKNPPSGGLKHRIPELKSTIQTKTKESDFTPENKDKGGGGGGDASLYTEITVIPNQSDHRLTIEKPMETLKPPPTPEYSSSPSSSLRSNRSSGFILNILSRSPRFKRKYRHDYETVSARDEDSTYSNASVASASARIDAGGQRRSNLEIRKNDPKVEEDEQILEALRHVVRKCTNQDPMKRPSSRDLFDLVEITYDKS